MLGNILNEQFQKMLESRKTLGFSVDENTMGLLKPFIRYCGELFPDENTIKEYMLIQWLEQHNYDNPNSLNVFLSQLNALTSFILFTGGDISFSPIDYTTKWIRHIPSLPNDEEIISLFQAIDTLPDRPATYPPVNLIFPVLTRFMFLCGMRPQEPGKLVRDEVDLSTGDIYIRKSKKNKDRHIIISEDMRNLCSIFDSLQDRNRYYFFEFNGKPILTSWIWNNLRKTIRDNGLENLYSFRPYDFRHLFASRTIMKWIDNKQDVMKLLPYLSVYMGHSDIKYTMYYVHLLPERLKKTSGIDWTIFNQIYGGIDNEDS